MPKLYANKIATNKADKKDAEAIVCNQDADKALRLFRELHDLYESTKSNIPS